MNAMTDPFLDTRDPLVKSMNQAARRKAMAVVRAAVIEECAKVAEQKSARLPHQDDFTRGYACGRSGAAADIRALKTD